MLTIDTAQLAEALYVAWRERMEFVAPLGDEGTRIDGWRYRSRLTRPAWRLLTAQQQAVWLHVAATAGRAVADAMDLASA